MKVLFCHKDIRTSRQIIDNYIVMLNSFGHGNCFYYSETEFLLVVKYLHLSTKSDLYFRIVVNVVLFTY